MYMGSKTGEHPDDILKENHQMLASVHSGRSESIAFFHFFFNSHYLRKVIFSFHFGNVSTALSKPKLLIFILTDMVSEDLQPSSLMNRLPKFLVIFFSNFSMFKLVLAHYASNVA